MNIIFKFYTELKIKDHNNNIRICTCGESVLFNLYYSKSKSLYLLLEKWFYGRTEEFDFDNQDLYV